MIILQWRQREVGKPLLADIGGVPADLGFTPYDLHQLLIAIQVLENGCRVAYDAGLDHGDAGRAYEMRRAIGLHPTPALP